MLLEPNEIKRRQNENGEGKKKKKQRKSNSLLNNLNNVQILF